MTIDLPFHDVVSLVYDPRLNSLQTTRGILHECGFRQIETTADIEEFAGRLVENEPDLAICEIGGQDGDAVEVVRRLRAGDLGGNPFLVVIMTSWRRTEAAVTRAMNAGADDILVRPFSTAAVAQRIKACTLQRKDFIVTGQYVGPDRRSDARGEGVSAPLFTPPNTLRAVVSGDADAKRAELRKIETVSRGMERQQLKRLTLAVAVTAQLMMAKAKPTQGDYAELDRTARELRRRMRRSSSQEHKNLADILVETTADLLDVQTRTERGLEMVLTMAKNIAVGGLGVDDGAFTAEVVKTAAALSKRLAANLAKRTRQASIDARVARQSAAAKSAARANSAA
ncbi:MAG: two-component system response regulator [Maricaulaceae bacterium]